MTMTPELRLAAIHEAGHSTAATMRGGSELIAAWIYADGSGLTRHRSHEWDQPFIAYAGPWAEARSRWPASLPLAGEDDDGLIFDDYVTRAFLDNPDDAAIAFRPSPMPGVPSGGTSVAFEAVWVMELEREWPAIQAKAADLLTETALDAPSVAP